MEPLCFIFPAYITIPFVSVHEYMCLSMHLCMHVCIMYAICIYISFYILYIFISRSCFIWLKNKVILNVDISVFLIFKFLKASFLFPFKNYYFDTVVHTIYICVIHISHVSYKVQLDEHLCYLDLKSGIRIYLKQHVCFYSLLLPYHITVILKYVFNTLFLIFIYLPNIILIQLSIINSTILLIAFSLNYHISKIHVCFGNNSS